MQTYLAIITTALVLTQIIRLIQNTIQLRHIKKTDKRSAEIEQLWNDLTDAMYTLIDSTDDLKTEIRNK